MDRRIVLSEIETAQKTLEVENAPMEARANMYESALNIVDRHKMKLQVGCRRQGQNLSQLEKNRLALGLLKSLRISQQIQVAEGVKHASTGTGIDENSIH